jgi:hypothetical protein
MRRKLKSSATILFWNRTVSVSYIEIKRLIDLNYNFYNFNHIARIINGSNVTMLWRSQVRVLLSKPAVLAEVLRRFPLTKHRDIALNRPRLLPLDYYLPC